MLNFVWPFLFNSWRIRPTGLIHEITPSFMFYVYVHLCLSHYLCSLFAISKKTYPNQTFHIQTSLNNCQSENIPFFFFYCKEFATFATPKCNWPDRQMPTTLPFQIQAFHYQATRRVKSNIETKRSVNAITNFQNQFRVQKFQNVTEFNLRIQYQSGYRPLIKVIGFPDSPHSKGAFF